MNVRNEIARMMRAVAIIKQYNNFRQLGAEEDIDFLKEKLEKLIASKDPKEIQKEFMWCAKMINMYWNEIEPEFKQQIAKEEKEAARKEAEIDNKVQNGF